MGPRNILLVGLAVGLLGVVIDGTCSGSSGPRKKTPLPAFTPQREEAALQFVAKNHAELLAVLDRLKKLNREQYEQAVRELFQESAKLALVKKGDEKLYSLMLDSWKTKSRSDVIAARLACTKDNRAELEEELKSLLYRQVDLHRQTVEHNRLRLLRSLKVMEANIQLLKDNRDQIVERRFRNLTRKRANKNAK